MGTIKCKTCSSTWTVSTTNAEIVIAQNHTYLNGGHRTVTSWDVPREAATLPVLKENPRSGYSPSQAA